jgi:hypothetical protein
MNESRHTFPENNEAASITLNEAQKRYISASLVTLEKLLRQVLFLLHDNGKGEIFYKKDNDIPEEISTVLEQQIFSLLEKFKEIKDRYYLQPVKEKQSRLVASQISLCWAGLLDLRPKILSGYGSLPVSLSQELETEIYSLSQTVTGLINLVNQSNNLNSTQK